MVTTIDRQRNTIMTALSDNIRILRTARGWSQDELADKVGVSRATINRIEQGHRMPDFDLVCRLADAFETKTDRLRKSLAEELASA